MTHEGNIMSAGETSPVFLKVRGRVDVICGRQDLLDIRGGFHRSMWRFSSRQSVLQKESFISFVRLFVQLRFWYNVV